MRAHVHLYSTALVRGVLALRSAMTEYVSAYNAVGQKQTSDTKRLCDTLQPLSDGLASVRPDLQSRFEAIMRLRWFCNKLFMDEPETLMKKRLLVRSL